PASPPSLKCGICGGLVSAITIRNGAIIGFTFPATQPCLNSSCGTMWTLEDLVLASMDNAQGGLGFAPFARIRHVTAPTNLITVACPSVVAETTALSIGISSAGSGNCALVNNATP